MITRYDYLNLDSEGRTIDNEYHRAPYNREESNKRHHAYYSQFVNRGLKNLVLERFSLEQLKTAYKTDENLNNWGNAPWDKLMDRAYYHVSAQLLKDVKQGWSLNTSICILKAAARELIFEAFNGEN